MADAHLPTGRRDLSRFDEPVHSFAGVDVLLAAPVPAGVLTVDYGGSPLDLLHRPRGSATTVVVFHTALSPSMRTLPVFSGRGVTSDLDVNLVSISDPSLLRDPTLKLAWFAGNDRQPLQRDLPGILAHVLHSHGAQHVVFFGASGGGFAAMYYSHFFPGSLAVPVNPQVILKDYSDEALLAYASACFGARDLAEARSVAAERVTGDLRHLYRGGYANTVAYVQNLQDTIHLYRHLTHFLRAVPVSRRLGLLVERWGRGHVPPPHETVREVLRAAVEADGRWDRMLDDGPWRVAPDSEWPVAVREGTANTPRV